MRTSKKNLRVGIATGTICLMVLAGCGISTSGATKHLSDSTATTSTDAGPDSTRSGSKPTTTEAAATTTEPAVSSTTPATTKDEVKTNPDTDWRTSAGAYNDDPVGTKVRFTCPPNGVASSVWGSGPYTSDSSVCTAAAHHGTFTVAKGGSVVIKTAGAEKSFSGTEANGVTTDDWNQFDHTFTIVEP